MAVGPDTVRIDFTLPKALKRRLVLWSTLERKPLNAGIRKALDEFLTREGYPPMHEEDYEPGKDGYEAYGFSANWLTYDGKKMPDWSQLPHSTKKHWEAVEDMYAEKFGK